MQGFANVWVPLQIRMPLVEPIFCCLHSLRTILRRDGKVRFTSLLQPWPHAGRVRKDTCEIGAFSSCPPPPRRRPGGEGWRRPFHGPFGSPRHSEHTAVRSDLSQTSPHAVHGAPGKCSRYGWMPNSTGIMREAGCSSRIQYSGRLELAVHLYTYLTRQDRDLKM